MSPQRLTRRRAFGWIAVALVAAALIFARQRPSDDIFVMLPMNDPLVRDFYRVANDFKTLESLYIDVSTEPDEAADVNALFAAGDALYARLAGSGMFQSIRYQIRPEEFETLGELIGRAQASLLSERDFDEIERRLAPAQIPAALARAKGALMGPTGMFEQNRIRRDPFKLAGLTASKFAGLGKRGPGAEILNGAVVTGDHRHLLIFAVPSFPPSDLEGGRALIALLDDARDAIESLPGNSVRIRYAGGHFAHVDNAAVIQRDLKRTTIAVVIGIAFLSLLVFQRPLASVLVLAPAAFGLLAGTALFTLVNPHIAHVVLGCASLLVGITVDYGIHVLYHDRADHAASPPKRLQLSMLAAAATTIAGFVSLLFSRVPGFRELGAIGIVGIFCSLAFAVYLLPKLAAYAPQHRRVLPIPRWVRRAQDWMLTHRRPVLVAIGCVLAVCAFGAGRVRFEGDLRRLSYLSPAHARDDAELRAVWEPFVASSVVVTGSGLESALRENDRLVQTLNRLRAQGVIEDYVSISDILPSEQTQRARWVHWREFWSPDRLGRTQAETRSAAASLGFAPSAFDDFFARVASEPRPLTPADYERSGLEELVTSRIARQGDSVLVQTSIITSDLVAFHRTSDAIRAEFPTAVVVNGQAFAEHAKTLILSEMLWLAGWSVLLVGLCLFFAFGAVELAFAVLAPVVISLVITFGILGFLGVPLNLISVLFVVFVVGAGDDYSIFLFGSALSAYRSREQTRDENTGASVVLCALTTLFGFGALLLAEHPALRTIGITASIGILACVFTCFAVSPLIASFLLPAGGRYGVVTGKGAMRAAWTICNLSARTLLYVTVARNWHSLRNLDSATRARRARNFIRRAFGRHLAGFPYRRNENFFINDDPAPFDRPAIVVSNHQSLFDIVRLASLPNEVVAVVKEWVIRTPIMGTLLRDAGYISTGRGTPQDTLDRCREALDEGLSVLFFPEGTRSPDGRLRRFHLGAFELAAQTQHDLLPILLTNTRSCIRRKGFAIGEFSSVLHRLPRVTPASFDFQLGAKALMHHVRDTMEAARESDWALSQSDAQFWPRLAEGYRYQGLRHRLDVAWTRRNDPLLAALDSIVPPRGRIWDLNCGLGLRARFLAMKSMSRRITGADADLRKLEVARAASRDDPNVDFKPLSLGGPAPEPLDCILLVDGLSAANADALALIFSWCASSLATEGRIVMRAPDGSPASPAFGKAIQVPQRNAADYRALLSKCGFEMAADRPDLARKNEFVWILKRCAR